MFDVVRGPKHPFTLCGYDTSAGHDRTFLLVADQWGRVQNLRRASEENGLGARSYELADPDEGFLLVGTDGESPLLVGGPDPLAPPAWIRTYDGTPEGAVHAATPGDDHVVGWTEAVDPPEPPGVRVVGTDATGEERWSDRSGDGRRLVDLLPADADPGSFLAIGTRADSPGGWTTAWEPDGTQVRDTSFETPGDGPASAVIDGEGLVLAGTSEEGWWLQRRRPDRGVDWTRTYPADGDDRGVDDLVTQEDGYGLLAHDTGGTVVLRTGPGGEVRWWGRYAPYTDDDGPADRGHAMVPVDDEFVITGATAPGEEGRDWWIARVGEPGVATPYTPDPTPTPPPNTIPPTTSPPTDSAPAPSDPPTPTAAGTRTPEPSADGSGASPTSGDGPGFGVLAAFAGLSGWLAARRRDQ
jgi:hypothetical protein